jgi:hypothetical protein
MVGNKWYLWKDECKDQVGLDDQTDKQVIILPIMRDKYQDLANPDHRDYLLKHSWAREIARKTL